MNKATHPEIDGLALRLGALAHPARLRILRHLAEEECCCCKDVVHRLDLAQSTVSQHLKVLVEAGLVSMETAGQRSHYRIDRTALAGLAGSMDDLIKTCCAPSARP